MKLKDELERALFEDGTPTEGLRTVVVSAMPDGLVVWSWVEPGRAIAAHEFAALGRAAAACLLGLAVESSAMTLALRVDALQVYSWPLTADGRLVVHFVFDGDLLAGLARTQSERLRDRLLAAVSSAGLLRHDPLRESLIDLLLLDSPEVALLELVERSGLSLAELEWPEVLAESSRIELSAAVDFALGERLLSRSGT
ncbi:hypothetical protein ACNOYE_13335 [Nannocystaceae bacterium ST9]